MEVTGLTIGVVALAGLCSTCLEAFSLIGIAKNFSVDSEILCIKLDIEKTRLLQWAEGVGLVADDQREQNVSLPSPHIQPQLERILTAVKLLLTQSDDLCTKYGLSPEKMGFMGATSGLIPAVSIPRTQAFQAAFARLQAKISHRQKATALATKTQWVIKDREKFEGLLRNLHQLVSSLIDLVALPGSFRRLLIKEDIDALADNLSHLRLLQVASKEQDNEWSEFASLRVEASQKATRDFRTLEEWLEDVDNEDKASANSPSKAEDDTADEVLESVSNDPAEATSEMYEARNAGALIPAAQSSYPSTQPDNVLFAMSSEAWNQILKIRQLQGKSLDLTECLTWISLLRLSPSFRSLKTSEIQVILELLVRTLTLIEEEKHEYEQPGKETGWTSDVANIKRDLQVRQESTEDYRSWIPSKDPDIDGLRSEMDPGTQVFTHFTNTGIFTLVTRQSKLFRMSKSRYSSKLHGKHNIDEASKVYQIKSYWYQIWKSFLEVEFEHELQLIEGNFFWGATARTTLLKRKSNIKDFNSNRRLN